MYSHYVECIEEEAPSIMKDFNLWMIETNGKKNWRNWDSRMIIGYILDYLSSVYIMFPETLVKGEYTEKIPLKDPNLKSENTEYEIFLYNTFAEMVRVDVALFKL